jgi:hypothetical protein
MSEANKDLTAPVDASLLTPAQAGEMLQRMAGEPSGKRPLPNDPHAMTREEAGRALEQLGKQPLPTADPIADAIAGRAQPDMMHTSLPGSTTLPPMKLADFAGALRENGFDNTAVEFVLREKTVTAAEREWAGIKKAELLADPAWAARYLNGDVKARHDMMALTYMTSAETAEVAP